LQHFEIYLFMSVFPTHNIITKQHYANGFLHLFKPNEEFN
jgi:hypothetical protein